MFQDSETTSVDFLSAKAKSFEKVDNHSQTPAVPSCSSATQCSAGETSTAQTQVVETSFIPEDASVEVEEQKLKDFLFRVLGLVLPALTRNLKSTAFSDYFVNRKENIELTVQGVVPRMDFSGFLKQILISANQEVFEEELRETHRSLRTCSALNMNASLVAISYGHHDHVGWCTHPGAVAVYSLSKIFSSSVLLAQPHSQAQPSTQAAKKGLAEPLIVLHTPTCATFVSFHPSLPGILAVGTFTGDIMIWDILRRVTAALPLMSTRSGDVTHKEAVVAMRWVNFDAARSSAYRLVVLSRDGRLAVWALGNKLSAPVSVGQCVEAVPLRRKDRPGATQKVTVGGVVFGHDGLDRMAGVVGGENGHIFKVSLHPPKEKTSTVYNAVLLKYAGHSAALSAIEFNPFVPGVFLTCGFDGFVHIYNVLRREPVLTLSLPSSPDSSAVLQIPTACCWSRLRPLVIAVLTSEGHLHLFDLLLNTNPPIVPVLSLNVCQDLRHLLSDGSLSSSQKALTHPTGTKIVDPALVTSLRGHLATPAGVMLDRQGSLVVSFVSGHCVGYSVSSGLCLSPAHEEDRLRALVSLTQQLQDDDD
eukprot:GCRY01000928.1.p1 GENE.GCRY01000928.1~~GCRY01000928.1.p1  ORF type:complete len:589 (+),score=155.60 GCRY01000928.1:342-2108(+)